MYGEGNGPGSPLRDVVGVAIVDEDAESKIGKFGRELSTLFVLVDENIRRFQISMDDRDSGDVKKRETACHLQHPFQKRPVTSRSVRYSCAREDRSEILHRDVLLLTPCTLNARFQCPMVHALLQDTHGLF